MLTNRCKSCSAVNSYNESDDTNIKTDGLQEVVDPPACGSTPSLMDGGVTNMETGRVEAPQPISNPAAQSSGPSELMPWLLFIVTIRI